MPGESNMRAGVTSVFGVPDQHQAARRDEHILQLLAELRVEVSALRADLLGQNQQMLSRMQFLHEGLVGRIKQIREQATPSRRRFGRP
jgi:hypothetical protein